MLPHRRGFGVASAAITPPTTQDLAFWWVSSDVATNTVVTNWVDRIHGAVLSNTFGTVCPTNSATGMCFNGASNQVLFTSGVDYPQTATVWMIVQRTGSGTFQIVLAADAGGTSLFGYESGTWHLYRSGVNRIVDGDPSTNSFFDIGFTAETTVPALIGYTNGVSYATNATTLSATNTWTRVGGVNLEYFTGKVKEILIFTNSALSAIQMAGWHQYGTNLYGYTP